jgi:hypothetical protein
LEFVDRMGDWIARSTMFGCTRVEQGKILAMHCYVTGMSPVELLRIYDIIDGKLSKKSMAAAAEFRQKGGKYRWINQGDDGQEAAAEFTFEGQTLVVRYTIKDATRQGLVKPNSNWVKTPGNMLRARMMSNAIGMLAPEIYAGDEPSDAETPAPASLELANATPAALPAAQPKMIENANAPVTLPIERKVVELQPVLVDEDSETVAEAAMGLAPVQPTNPVTPKPESRAMEPTVAALNPADGPMEPPMPIEPEAPSAPAPVKTKPPASQRPNPLVPPDQLLPETVEAIGQIIAGNFLSVAKWMIKERWLPIPVTEPADEAHAAVFLQDNLQLLSQSRAKRILTKKMAFMRAVEEIAP